MKHFEELEQSVNKVVYHANEILSCVNTEVFNKAPIIVHQRFCHELVSIAKEAGNKSPDTIPEFLDILKAIDVLEKLYPELKK